MLRKISNKFMIHEGQRHHENHVSNDPFWKGFRENMAEMHKSMRYMSELCHELNLRDPTMKRESEQPVQEEDDCPIHQDDVSNDDVTIDDMANNTENVDIYVEQSQVEQQSEESKEREIHEKGGSIINVCEERIVLFSKRHMREFVTERACFLIGDLKPCYPSVCFELLQEVKALFEKIDSKVNNGSQHVDFEAKAFLGSQNFKFSSKFIHGKMHKVFKPGNWVWRHYWKDRLTFQKNSKRNQRRARPLTPNDFKSALQGECDVNYKFNAANFRPFDVGDPFDSRTNPLEEGEDDMN